MSDIKLKVTIYLLCSLFFLLSSSVFAEDDNVIMDDSKASETEQSALGIKGENIDIRTGTYYWEITDILLPGTAGLEVQVARSWNKSSFSSHRAMSNWELEIPRIQQTVHPTGAAKSGYCSEPKSRIAHVVSYTPLPYREYQSVYSCQYESVWDAKLGRYISEYVCGYRSELVWVHPPTQIAVVPLDWFSGMFLVIPGHSPKPLLFRVGTAYPSAAKYVTADNWVVNCTSIPESGLKNGYVVTSPEGTQYRMDVIGIEKGDKGSWTSIYPYGVSGITPGSWDVMPGDKYAAGYATQVTAYVSEIVDRFGNSISYEYTNLNLLDGGRWGSSLIRPLLKKINASDGRAVSFQYDGSSKPLLEKAIVNGKEWQYRYSSDRNYLESVMLPDNSTWQYFYSGPLFTKSSPSLLNVDYLKGRKYLDKIITPLGLNIQYAYTSIGSDYFGLRGTMKFPENLVVLQGRTSSGVNVPTGNVTFSYSKVNSSNVTTIGGDRREKYEYSRNSKLLGALTTASIYQLDGNILENTINSWSAGSKIGESGFENGTLSEANEYRRILKYTSIERDNALMTTGFRNFTSYENHDMFGRPRIVIESGTRSKRTDFTYFDANTYDVDGKWIVGITEDVLVYNNDNPLAPVLAGSIYRSFNSNGQLESINNFGISQSYEYYNSGELKKQKYKQFVNDPFIEVEYKNYKLGTPQREEHPLGVVVREVDDFGRIASETDADGIKTVSTYDDLGRLSSISIPGEAVKSILWTSPTYQSISKHNYRENNTYDAMGRLVLSEKYDSDNPSKKIYVRYGYDKYGNLNFESMPSHLSSETKGEETAYDLLGRRKSVTNTVDQSTTKYFYGDQWSSQRVTGDPEISILGFGVIDSRGYKSVYELDAFGTTNDTVHKKIFEQVSSDPNKYVVTEVNHDVLGNKTKVIQGGFTRTFSYYPDKPKLLHTITHPETGVTTYTYDEAGNKRSQKVGTAATVNYDYDKQNRLQLIDYPADTADVDFDYYPSGKLKFIDNGLSRWDYIYTDTGKLKTEKLQVIGDQFELGYQYNLGGDLNAITYPNNEIVTLNPDAFGRARQVGKYVDAVTYHPDGFIASYKYRNGHTTYIDQNAKGFIEEIRSGVGSNYSMRQHYDYDKNGNVLSQADYVNNTNSISMEYDGLSRLKVANSASWEGVTRQYSYDDVGNILTKKIGNTVMTYSYNPATNLLESVSGGYNFSYDLYGNVKSNGKNTFNYDAAGHLVSVGNSPSMEYIYDGHGHRVSVSKNKNGVTTDYFSVYNKSGTLLHRKDSITGDSTNYYYLGHRLVASNLDCSAKDSDKDSIPDCVEDGWGLNKNNASDSNADLDGDGVSNLYEYAYDLNPKAVDSNGNGSSDLFELQNNVGAVYSIDSDQDGLSDYLEFLAKSDPLKKDTDGDGIEDGVDSSPTLNQGVLVAIISILLN